MLKVRNWFRNRWKELSIGDPNSPEGFRERARRLIKSGYSLDNPYVTMLLKRALMEENRGAEIPKPTAWEIMSDEEKEDWVLKQLGGKIG